MSVQRTAIAAAAVAALVAGGTSLAHHGEDDTKVVARKFNHGAHVSRGVKIGEACNECHEPDPNGALVPVGKDGHAPCMDAGCHVTDFLSINKKDKESTERYHRAVAFCLGCHQTEDGGPPVNYKKAEATNAFVGNDNPGYHVELDHADHIDRAKCTECHVVDERTYEALYKPGHAQCAKCHSAGAQGAGKTPTMGLCSGCHDDPGRNEFFASATRKELDLKSCDSEWRDEMTDEEKDATPCFRHERKEHRFDSDGAKLQCDTCHYMVSKNKDKFRSIQQIKGQQIIDGTSMDNYCSAKGCHPDVDSTKPGKCERCHHKNIRKKLLEGFVHG